MIQYYITDKGIEMLDHAARKVAEGEMSFPPEILVLVFLKEGWSTEQIMANAAENIGERQARRSVPKILKGMERGGYIAKDVPLDDADLEGNGTYTELPSIFKKHFSDNI